MRFSAKSPGTSIWLSPSAKIQNTCSQILPMTSIPHDRSIVDLKWVEKKHKPHLVLCWFCFCSWFWHILELLFFLTSVEVVLQCVLVDFSVRFISRKNEASTSIEILFIKLWHHFSSCPAWDNNLFFLVFISVFIIATNDDQDFASLKYKTHCYTLYHLTNNTDSAPKVVLTELRTFHK